MSGESMSLWESNDSRVPVLERGWCGCVCVGWRVLPCRCLMLDLRSSNVCIGWSH